MSKELADRVLRIKPSPTAVVTSRADELQAAGHNVINLGIGEPDFDTPDHIKEAAIKAIRDGFTKYTPVDGTRGLKAAIVEKFKRENNLSYEAKQILVSCGAKQSIFNLCAALLNAGDEVIIPAPYWVSYPDMVKLCDATPVIISADISQRFKITAAQLEKAITPKTRLFILNSPSNPSGIAYNKKELKELADVLRKHPDIIIATDDIYEHILWTGEPFTNILNVCPELYPQTVVINGVSKSYAMTGWRIGYAAGPEKIIGAMKKVQSQSTSNPTSISQVAAEAALRGNQECVKAMCKEYKKRHDIILVELQKIPGVKCIPGDGTFYVFADMNDLIAELPTIQNDLELATLLLDQGNVGTVPGSAFGLPGYLRISFATSTENIAEAIRRIKTTLEKAGLKQKLHSH